MYTLFLVTCTRDCGEVGNTIHNIIKKKQLSLQLNKIIVVDRFLNLYQPCIMCNKREKYMLSKRMKYRCLLFIFVFNKGIKYSCIFSPEYVPIYTQSIKKLY